MFCWLNRNFCWVKPPIVLAWTWFNMIKPHQTMYLRPKNHSKPITYFQKIPNHRCHSIFRPQKSITITSEPSSHQTAGWSACVRRSRHPRRSPPGAFPDGHGTVLRTTVLTSFDEFDIHEVLKKGELVWTLIVGSVLFAGDSGLSLWTILLLFWVVVGQSMNWYGW